VFAAATRTYELLASIATIDEASPGNRCLRDGAALGAVYALCGLDLVDACAAEPLLARIRAQRACTDRTRWERVAALLVQAQCTDECTPPATIAECQDAAANESGEFAQLAGAIAGRRLGDLQPLHALLGSLPDGDDAQLQLIESRARRELARR
jgi:hypothetical protein